MNKQTNNVNNNNNNKFFFCTLFVNSLHIKQDALLNVYI